MLRLFIINSLFIIKLHQNQLIVIYFVECKQWKNKIDEIIIKK